MREDNLCSLYVKHWEKQKFQFVLFIDLFIQKKALKEKALKGCLNNELLSFEGILSLKIQENLRFSNEWNLLFLKENKWKSLKRFFFL